jgi:hypothetical protein
MTTLTQNNARERALHDWELRSARKLVVGTVDIARPRFSWGELFVTESISYDYSDEAELFCRTYNNTIRALLAQYGIPPWAPVKRLPDAFTCLSILASESSSFAEYQAASAKEEAEVNRILLRWGRARPALFARQVTLALLIWGGSLDDQSGRVDVFDLLDGEQWLAFYTYPRIEFPHFPWDQSVHSVTESK